MDKNLFLPPPSYILANILGGQDESGCLSSRFKIKVEKYGYESMESG